MIFTQSAKIAKYSTIRMITFLLHRKIKIIIFVPEKIKAMTKLFAYDNYATGNDFLGRNQECMIISNLLKSGEHVSIYEPPKAGKMSVIQQSLFNLRNGGVQFVAVFVDMMNVRTLNDFLVKFGTAVLKASATTPDVFSSIVKTHLADTHFVFDHVRFATHNELVSMNWDPDMNDVERMLELPQALASTKQTRYVMILNDFQNLMNSPAYEDVFKAMERMLKGADYSNPHKVTYIMSGSMVNAMKYIFEEKKFFHRLANHVTFNVVDSELIADYVTGTFLKANGKKIERKYVIDACGIFRGNLWYINQFSFFCDALTKGYVTPEMVNDALKSMISVYQPRFMAIVNDLTDHQLSLLRAVLDGVVKFSSSDVIEKYRLNSSANVRRVKDALRKKEVITFNEKDEPVILDPFFEYWVRHFYFEIGL